MKKLLLIGSCLFLSLAARQAGATVIYWDPEGTYSYTGSGSHGYTGSLSQTWENSEWCGISSGATGAAFTNNDAVCFSVGSGVSTPAFTVTMNANHSIAGFFDGSLSPNSSSVTVTGTGIATMTAGNLNGFACDNSSDGAPGDVTLNVVVAGGATAGICAEETTGQQFLNGVNTYSGGTFLGYSISGFASIWNFNNGSSFGTGPIVFLNCAGGALVSEGTAPITIANTWINYNWSSASANLNIVGNPAGVTFSGPVFLSQSSAIGTGGGIYATNGTVLKSYPPVSIGSGGVVGDLVTFSGVMSGTNNFYKYGVATLALSGVDTFTGNLAISNGILAITGAGQLGSGTYASFITNRATFAYSSSAAQTLSGVMSATGSLIENGPGELTLAAADTYTGPTTINSGTLALSAAGSINASSALTIIAGGTFDVSAADPYTLSSSTTLDATGTGAVTGSTAATINDASANANPSVTLGAKPINLAFAPTSPNGDSTHPALLVNFASSSGALTLSGSYVVNLTNNGPGVLAAGSYYLIQESGNAAAIIGGGPGGTVNIFSGIGGYGLAPGASASIGTDSTLTNLVLTVSGGLPTPLFSGLTASQSIVYGTSGITLAGQVSAPGPVYPSMGETITVTIDGNAQPVQTIDAMGDFSFTYTSSTIPVTGSPFTITYSYPGDVSLNGVNNTTTTLTVTKLPLTVTATGVNKVYNGNTVGTVTLSDSPLNGDTVTAAYTSATFASPNPGTGITVSVSGISISGSGAANYSLANTTATTTANITIGASDVWNGGDFGTSPDWSDAGNWVGTIAPNPIGDSVDFTGSVGPTPVMQTSYTNYSLTFDNAAAITFTLANSAGSTLSVGQGGITNASSLPQIISLPVSLLSTSQSDWSVASGSSLVINSNLTDAGGGLNMADGGNLELYGGTLKGVVSGVDQLDVVGPGTLTLSGTNTYTGITAVSNGLVTITNDFNLGAAPASFVANQLTLNNAIISGTNYVDYGVRVQSDNFALSPNRGIYLGPNGGAFNMQSGFTCTIQGVISGPGAFYSSPNASAGYGTIAFSNQNTYAGPTYICAGTLFMDVSGALPVGTPLTIGSSFQGAADGSFLLLNGTSQTIGPLASTNGFGALGTGNPTVQGPGTLTVYETNVNTAFAGAIINATSLAIAVPAGGTAGKLTLGGTNTYTGSTTISAATLALSGKGAISNTSSINIAAGAEFDVSGLTATTYFLGTTPTLTASGTGTTLGSTAAAINGASIVNLGVQAISLTFTPTAFSGDSAHPALYISQGALTLNGNVVSVNNAGASPLGAGVYTLIQVAGGTINGTPASAVTVTGSGIAEGATASLSVSSGNVVLTVVAPPSPTISSVTSTGTTVTITATGGVANGNYVLLESTNLALPLSQWTTAHTGSFDGSGNLNLTIPYVNPSDTQEYFVIEIQQ